MTPLADPSMPKIRPVLGLLCDAYTDKIRNPAF